MTIRKMKTDFVTQQLVPVLLYQVKSATIGQELVEMRNKRSAIPTVWLDGPLPLPLTDQVLGIGKEQARFLVFIEGTQQSPRMVKMEMA